MIPSGRMYLADAGFGTRRGVILPFPLQRYHLQDWRYADRPPETKEELFNLRHSRLRVGVEQTIGLDKRKWKIIRCSAPEYRFRDQIALIYVVTGLHNFIKLDGKEPGEAYEEMEASLILEERGKLQSARQRADSVVGERGSLKLRELIAKWTWEDYQDVLPMEEG
ncbi:hypothetical protein S40285_10746 [Stachybotrys chlorohalonatus IBT 40285]|uniref:DDE Tnp4 domain-containing protein n=1 Tax=Stachybotrys chlorohalonatus (strain IBT 40285) TaxID=1283841 RepID=A0A084QSB9_STAC4|nr:hypothetical protein S40285_10746 [Stachybotrys chlorohalonata IBT 40285]